MSLDHARLHLAEHRGDAVPNGLVYLYVLDVEAAAAAVGVPAIATENNPWGCDFEAKDPDGNWVRVGTPPQTCREHANQRLWAFG